MIYCHLCLAAFLGDIALDEEDLRFLKANYMDVTLNDSSNFPIPVSGEYGCQAQTAAIPCNDIQSWVGTDYM